MGELMTHYPVEAHDCEDTPGRCTACYRPLGGVHCIDCDRIANAGNRELRELGRRRLATVRVATPELMARRGRVMDVVDGAVGSVLGNRLVRRALVSGDYTEAEIVERFADMLRECLRTRPVR